MDANAIRQKVKQLEISAAKLEGIRAAYLSQQNSLMDSVGQAKARQGLGAEITRIFEAMQTRAHERSVGAFNRLLTAVLNDVLPGEGNVRLLPEIKNNTTWLDIVIENDGEAGDVLEGEGGAVTNVISTGLQFAALSRTNNRRLMVLDEADCWVKPDRIAAFIRVIAQVSSQTNTQTFFISHHDPDLFKELVNIVHIDRDEQGEVIAFTNPDEILQHWADPTEKGVRAIELINFRKHSHTYVPCFPGATAFLGPNNNGKSHAIASALKVVAYGESTDSVIKRKCDEARVIFHLENNQRIEWSRSRTRAPVVIYRLFQGDSTEALMESPVKGRNSVPDWVVELLGVKKIDDLNFQVGSQKAPVFLLSESAPRRAQILSVGREASHLPKLMKSYNVQKSADGEVVTLGEAQLAKLGYQLKQMNTLDNIYEVVANLTMESEELAEAVESQETLTNIVQRVAETSKNRAKILQEAKALEDVAASPELVDTTSLQRLTGILSKSTLWCDAVVPTMPDVPDLFDLQPLVLVGKKLGAIQPAIFQSLDELPSVPLMPELAIPSQLLKIIQDIDVKSRQVLQCQADYDVTSAAVSAQDLVLEKLWVSLGQECPACGAPLSNTMLSSNGAPHVH
ncbi:MAG: hypothetical protein Q7S87_08865 [Agitococcus sp.]|nr:hypothetical protein [Agitococcus sp.]MDO9177011.1 hypothetical protein [Agitococcus sp.]